MTDNTNGHAIADAMRIERVTAVTDSAIIDAERAGFSKSGTWATASGVAGAYGGTISWNALPNDGAEVAEWTFQVTPGTYRVSASLHRGAAIYGNNNPVTVLNGSEVVGSLTLDQSIAYNDYTLDSTSWKHLGVFTATSTLRVRMTDLGSGYLVADAVRIQKVADPAPIPLAAVTSIAIANPSFEAQLMVDGSVGPLLITNWGVGQLLNPTAVHFIGSAAPGWAKRGYRLDTFASLESSTTS